jgi:hypothetical protein
MNEPSTSGTKATARRMAAQRGAATRRRQAAARDREGGSGPKLSKAAVAGLRAVGSAHQGGARISNITGPLTGHPGEVGIYWQTYATLHRLGYVQLREGSDGHARLTDAGRKRLAELGSNG